MSAHPRRAHAQIVRVKQSLQVKIVNDDGRIIYARRDPASHRILYDRPESVPRLMKNQIVPQLFKQIDQMKWG